MKRALAAALAALSLAACATMPSSSPEYAAARDIQRLFIAIRDSDRATFERYVDRDALRTQLRGRVLAEASRQGQAGGALATLGALMGGSVMDFAADTAIQPEVFRAIAERRGYRPDMGMPTPDLIARYVRDIGGEAVCVVTGADDPCLLIFRRQGGAYRLVGYEGDLSQLMPGRRAAN